MMAARDRAPCLAKQCRKIRKWEEEPCPPRKPILNAVVVVVVIVVVVYFGKKCC